MGNEIIINSPQNVYVYNNTFCVESQEVEQTLDFHSELQRLHECNKKDLQLFFAGVGKNAKAERVKNCGNILTFKHYRDIGITKLDNASLCRERLCLNCNRLLSRDNASVLMQATKGMSLKHIVFSVKNCKGEYLRNTIENMKKALKYLLRSKKVKGYYQSYEITYNSRTKEFHPHIHILVESESISIKARELNSSWAKAFNRFAGTDYKWLSCKCKEVTDNIKGCFELSKYITKPQDFNSETIPIFDEQLKGLHLHQSNGIFKERCNNVKKIQEMSQEKEKEYLSNFDYELMRYIFNGENYIKCE